MTAIVFLGLALTSLPARAQAIFFVLDVSGSMGAADIDTAGTTRHAAMVTAVTAMINAAPTNMQMGFLSYDNTVQVDRTLTTDKAAFLTALAAIRPPGGTTATGDALNQGLNEIKNAMGKKVMILLTDGVPVPVTQTPTAISAATASGNAGVGICVIGFGRNVGVPGPDAKFLEDIATASSGNVILAADAAALATALDTCLSLFLVPRTVKTFAPVTTYPNPILGSATSVTFAAPPSSANSSDTSETAVLPSPITVVEVFDLSGRRIMRLPGGVGFNRIVWNTRNIQGQLVGSGMYHYIVEFADGKVGRGKFTIVR
jgi:uncharacterized protein YegL